MGSLFVSTAARRLGVSPRVLTGLFYNGAFDDERCPVVAGRRMIPESYLPEIERVLRERHLLVEVAAAGH